jgi:ABC-type multidrug transport system permease subunit
VSDPVEKRYSPLWQLTLARWRSFFREPSAIFWTFGFPVILSIALGVAFRNRPPDPVDVAVLAGPDAERLRDALAASTEIKVKVLDEEQAHAQLRSGKVSIVVVPGRPRTYRFDATRPEGRLARAVVDDLLQRADGRADPTPVADALVTEPGSRYIDFLIPGVLGMGLMQSGMWGIGYVLVEMRTRKLIKRLAATPMKRTHFLAAFVLMRSIFLVGELPILLIFASLVFHVPILGSLLLVIALSVLGAMVFAGLGLLVAARAANTQTVGGLINLVSMPMFICSGVFFSSARFPEFMQPAIKLLPLTALNDSLRAVMLDGAGPRGVAAPVVVMSAWGLASFVAALRLFRWR